MAEEGTSRQALDECRAEIRELKRDLYGNPNVKDQGVFSRLDHLEERFDEFGRTYEREAIERSAFGALDKKVGEMEVDIRIALMWSKAIAAGVGTIIVTLISGVAIAIFNWLMSSGTGA
jgi:hypothetical protein